MSASTEHPLFTVVTPVYNPPVEALTAAIDSVLRQTFGGWELILVDDCSPDPAVRETLRAYAARDARIRVIERSENGHIVKASNDGVAAARGQFIALLDHDDMLTPEALSRNAAVISRDERVDYLYSDEDKIDANGRHYDRFDKPDWSPERLRTHNYCCHLSVMRTELVREVGAFREGYDGSQDHDLILRVTERARRIHHIPAVLYHWRVVPGSAAGDAEAKPYAAEAGRRAVQDHLERVGVDATVELGSYGLYRVRRTLPAERRVSIVIPTLGSSTMVWGRSRVLVVEAVRSALARTRHEDLEVVVVYDEPTPRSVLEELSAIAGDRLVLVPFKEKFNYSRKVNFGVLASTGDRIIVLNDDVEVRSDDWIEELLGPLEEPDVGMTGAKLYFSSTAIQHAGLAFLRGGYQHPFHKMPSDNPGPFAGLFATREVSGVTGACVGMRRDTFFDVGGLTEGLPESFNDVDFCYKVLRLGYRLLFMAHCELFHFESQTREPTAKPADVRYMRRRWGIPDRDPYMPVFPNMPLTPAQKRLIKLKAERKRLGIGA
jgi:glycosyltransferase involved in cell wall biosynthesis